MDFCGECVPCLRFFRKAITEPYTWLSIHLFLLLRSDPLEEVVGLDIGYTGSSYKSRQNIEHAEVKMDDYLHEYEHRRREKADLFKMNLSPIPASSVHQSNLHGRSYHGRKVITQNMIDSLNVSDASQSSKGSRTYLRSASEPVNTSSAHSLRGGSDGGTASTKNNHDDEVTSIRGGCDSDSDF